MGGISDLVGALALQGVMRARDALEENRKSRQEESFVSFNLPPLVQQGQSIPQATTKGRPRIAVATSASHARSTPLLERGCL
jgi:hypothetical protein